MSSVQDEESRRDRDQDDEREREAQPAAPPRHLPRKLGRHRPGDGRLGLDARGFEEAILDAAELGLVMDPAHARTRPTNAVSLIGS